MDGSSTWAAATLLGTYVEFLTPVFSLVQSWLSWVFENEPVDERVCALSLFLSPSLLFVSPSLCHSAFQITA